MKTESSTRKYPIPANMLKPMQPLTFYKFEKSYFKPSSLLMSMKILVMV